MYYRILLNSSHSLDFALEVCDLVGKVVKSATSVFRHQVHRTVV